MTFLTDKTLETTRRPIFGVILKATVGTQEAKKVTCLKDLTKFIIMIFYINYFNEHIANIIHRLAQGQYFKVPWGD